MWPLICTQFVLHCSVHCTSWVLPRRNQWRRFRAGHCRILFRSTSACPSSRWLTGCFPTNAGGLFGISPLLKLASVHLFTGLHGSYGKNEPAFNVWNCQGFTRTSSFLWFWCILVNTTTNMRRSMITAVLFCTFILSCLNVHLPLVHVVHIIV